MRDLKLMLYDGCLIDNGWITRYMGRPETDLISSTEHMSK